MHESPVTYDICSSRTCVSHVTHMNESCHTYGMHHVTHDICIYIYAVAVVHERVMSQHVVHEWVFQGSRVVNDASVCSMYVAWHDAFICVHGWMWTMSCHGMSLHIYVWAMWLAWYIYVSHNIHICDMTHTYVSWMSTICMSHATYLATRE